MFRNLDEAVARLEALDARLMNPDVTSSPDRLREVTTERAHLVPVVETWQALEQAREEMEELRELMEDPEMREMAQADQSRLEALIPELEERLRRAVQLEDDGQEAVVREML